MMTEFKISAGTDPFKVNASVLQTGKDLVVVFGGGEIHHIGASALAEPRASLLDGSRVSASASVLCVSGHKDDCLAREAALRLATRYSCIVNVIVGLHVDNAVAEDIEHLVLNFSKCLVKVEELLDGIISG